MNSWIDPLINFIGGDISNAEVISQFCGNRLGTISLRTGCIFAMIHHTGKPAKEQPGGSASTASDLAYAGLGSSVLTNWAREVMVLKRVRGEDDTPVFSLTACKRRVRAGMVAWDADARAGMKDASGELSAQIFVRHAADGTIRWEQCEEPPKPPKSPKTEPGRPGRPRSEPSTPSSSYRLKKRDDGVETGRDYVLTSPPKPVGRPQSLSASDRNEIVALYDKNGGILSPDERRFFAEKNNVSVDTVRRFVQTVTGEAISEEAE